MLNPILLSLLCGLPQAGGQEAALGDDRLVQAFGERTLAYVEASDFTALVEALRGHTLIAPFTPKGGWLSGADTETREALEAIRATTGRSALELLAEMSDAGAAFGLEFAGLQPAGALLMRAENEARAKSALATMLDVVEQIADHPGAFNQPHETWDGVEAWFIGDELFIGRRGASIAVSNSKQSLKRRLANDATASSLADDAGFKAATSNVPENVDAFAWLDLERTLAIARLSDGEIDELLQLAVNPEGQILLGPGLSSAAHGNDVALWLSIESADNLSLGAMSSELGEAGAALRPASAAVARLEPTAETQLAHAMLYRDLGTLTGRRSEVLAPEFVAPLSAQLAELDVFFGGLRLADDVLPAISPWIEVVARRVDHASTGGTQPGLELPAVAFIISMHDAENTAHTLESAAQALTSIVNVERAQNGKSAMLLRLQRDGDRSWTTATWPDLAAGDVAGPEYNLRPAWSRVGDAFVVATHEALLIDLFDELGAAPFTNAAANADAPVCESLKLNGAAAAALVEEQIATLAMAITLSRGGDAKAARNMLDQVVATTANMQLSARLEYSDNALGLTLEVSAE